MLRLFYIASLLLLLSGCASYGVIDNAPLTESTATDSYSIVKHSVKQGSGDIVLTLAFSGGGTRAAALAYGVLEELRDTTVMIDGQPDSPVTPYFVQLGFSDIEQPEERLFFNQIPTSFKLSGEQVDRLIEAGHELLRNNPDYQRLLLDLREG